MQVDEWILRKGDMQIGFGPGHRGNGHSVTPTIARAMLLPPRPEGWKPSEDAKLAPRPYRARSNGTRIFDA
jgi:hypothetical protein